MVKPSKSYLCQTCGASQPKWSGQCLACGDWNSLIEKRISAHTPRGLGTAKGIKMDFFGLQGTEKQAPRRSTNNVEFDRVTGGGLVSGSATLVGGDPGIGKSTLLMQIAAALSSETTCAYISGEESIDQLRLRAARLNLTKATVKLAAITSVRDIGATLDGDNSPKVVIIDSIQCMFMDSIESAPGTVSQVRSSAQELIRLAKYSGFSLILVGHVTKEGTIAGPRVLEHMVDTVLYFEGENSNQFRILRSVKNRFGAANEIGVFEMKDTGLHEVRNPSNLFLSDYRSEISGASVFAGIEGTRPMLVEIQKLIASSTQATPRRAVIGWDASRLAMIIAVLETRCEIKLSGNEIYLNVAGGLKITEPAADLAVAAALISSVTKQSLPSSTVYFGEVGLAGEVRSVPWVDARINEAEKLGFTQAVIPRDKSGEINKKYEEVSKQPIPPNDPLTLFEIKHLSELVVKLGGTRMQAETKKIDSQTHFEEDSV